MPNPPPFEDLREFFENEDENGQLCDIVVPDAGPDAWARFLSLVAPTFPHTFTFTLGTSENDPPVPIPADTLSVVMMTESEKGPWPTLALYVRGLKVRALLYAPDCFEFDVMRREVTRDNYLGLTELMQRMGDAMGHDILITREAWIHWATLAYEASTGEFRAPRHGVSPEDALVRNRILADLRQALAPFRELRGKSLPRETLQHALNRVEAITGDYRELVLQDALSVEDRAALNAAWSWLAAIVKPAPGSGAEKYRGSYFRDLVKLAKRL